MHISLGVFMCAVQTYALIVSRKHYVLFYNQGYQAAVSTIVNNTQRGTPLLHNGNQPFYFDYYFHQTTYQPNYINSRIDSLSLEQFAHLLQSTQTDTIVIGHAFDLSPAYFEVAKLYFTHEVKHTLGLFQETYVLSRRTKPYDSTERIRTSDEFALKSELQLVQEANQPLRFSAQVFGLDSTAQLIIKVIDEQGNTLLEGTTCYRDVQSDISLTVLPLNGVSQKRKVQVWAFVFNPQKRNQVCSPVQLSYTLGNKWLYGTVEKVAE